MLSTYDIVRASFPDSHFINSPKKGKRDSSSPDLKRVGLYHRVHPQSGPSADFLYWQFAKRLRKHEWYFERFLPESDIVLSLGGDNYSMDYGGIERHLSANDRIIGAGKKLVIWGASIGPFPVGSRVEDWARRSLTECHAIIVREQLTRQYLEGIGVTKNVHVMPDPAFSLSADPYEIDEEIEEMLAEGAIGFNVSPLLAQYREHPEAWPDTVADWLMSICEATELPILLVPHVMYEGNDDHDFLQKVLHICQKKRVNSRIKLIDARLMSSRHIKYLISRLRAFIGARTHATIAGMSQNVPTISIGYSVKARGINLEVYGSEKWVIEHQSLTGAKLASLLLELLTDERAVREQLKDKNATYRMDPTVVKNLLS